MYMYAPFFIFNVQTRTQEAIVTGVGATPMHGLKPKSTEQKISAEPAHPFQNAAEANRTPSDIDMPAFLRKRYSSRQPAEIR